MLDGQATGVTPNWRIWAWLRTCTYIRICIADSSWQLDGVYFLAFLNPSRDNRILPPQYRVLAPGHQQLSTVRQIAAEHQAGQPGRVPGT
jgi:hypothetical protein